MTMSISGGSLEPICSGWRRAPVDGASFPGADQCRRQWSALAVVGRALRGTDPIVTLFAHDVEDEPGLTMAECRGARVDSLDGSLQVVDVDSRQRRPCGEAACAPEAETDYPAGT
jgi:hypothetical protein